MADEPKKSSKGRGKFNSGIMIKQCVCPHAYQDAVYGKQMRVHTMAGECNTIARCTVCNTEKGAK